MRLLYLIVLVLYALPPAGLLLYIAPVPVPVRAEELMITLPLMLFVLAIIFVLRENLLPRHWRQ